MAYPDTVGCAACGAENAVPFRPINFRAQPETVEASVDVADGASRVVAAVNPLWHATEEEYRDGNVYGEAAPCARCGTVQMPAVRGETAAQPKPPARAAGPGLGISQSDEAR
jgi:hypothetical protein